MEEPLIDPSWARLLETWDDEDRHRAFLQLCATADRLSAAAARYRVETETPEHASVARRQLVAIQALALSRLQTTRTRPATARWRAALVSLSLLLLAGAVVALLLVLGGG